VEAGVAFLLVLALVVLLGGGVVFYVIVVMRLRRRQLDPRGDRAEGPERPSSERESPGRPQHVRLGRGQRTRFVQDRR
jgi:hypothetical protein